MAFQNEYIPPVEQERSEFFLKARKTLHTGYSKYDSWTADRDREMVLFHRGSGRETDSANEDFWLFIDHQGTYEFDTKRLSKSEVSKEELAIVYEISRYWDGKDRAVPNTSTLVCIKEALCEYKDWGVVSDYKRCQLTLIDAATGEEI